MKTITKVVADDGTEFTSMTDCYAHEFLCSEIEEIMQALPKSSNDSCDFANGSGYVQHNRAVFLHAKRQLLKIGKRKFDHKWFDQTLADVENIDSSYCGRLIWDIGGPLRKAWYRIMCTDKTYREWGLPYYAMNPDKAKQVRLNP